MLRIILFNLEIGVLGMNRRNQIQIKASRTYLQF